MTVELRVEGKVLVIEAEGAVSIHFREDVAVPVVEAVVAPAPVLVPSPVPAFPPVPQFHDDGLFKRLAALRKELAVAAKVPPYVVFHDKTLLEIVEQQPADMEALSLIQGVGQAKLEKYGERVLEIIRQGA